MHPHYLSVDLGGTSLRMALLDGDAKLLGSETISSDLVRDPKRLAPEIRSLAERLSSPGKNKVAGLALGIPGLVDHRSGVVHRSPHFPRWSDVALCDQLQAELPYPVTMENDANQAALGESWKGAGRNGADFFLITLGTGVGGGIIIDGKIFHGPSGFAGEVGHIVIERGGRPGAIGRGTLETLASQSGLRALLKNRQASSANRLRSLDADSPDLPKQLHDLAQAGDAEALAIWLDLGDALGCGIASIAHTIGIFRCVLGGGLSGAWELFSGAALDSARAASYDYTAPRLQIVKAELGEQAGLIGGVKRLTAG